MIVSLYVGSENELNQESAKQHQINVPICWKIHENSLDMTRRAQATETMSKI